MRYSVHHTVGKRKLTHLKKDFKRLGERDSMYVDPMNNEGFGERDDLEREPWRERELESWMFGSCRDFCI